MVDMPPQLERLESVLLLAPQRCRELEAEKRPAVLPRLASLGSVQGAADQEVITQRTKSEPRTPRSLDQAHNRRTRCTTRGLSLACDTLVAQAVKNMIYWKRLGWASQLPVLALALLPVLLRMSINDRPSERIIRTYQGISHRAASGTSRRR
jgi:hypothetical protein